MGVVKVENVIRGNARRNRALQEYLGAASFMFLLAYLFYPHSLNWIFIVFGAVSVFQAVMVMIKGPKDKPLLFGQCVKCDAELTNAMIYCGESGVEIITLSPIAHKKRKHRNNWLMGVNIVAVASLVVGFPEHSNFIIGSIGLVTYVGYFVIDKKYKKEGIEEVTSEGQA